MLMVLGLMAVSVLVGCGGDPPTKEDFPDDVFLVYPGAEEVEQSFRPYEESRMIDTGTTSTPAEVKIRYRVPKDSSIGEVRSWYRDRWLALGWVDLPRDSAPKDPFESAYVRPEEESRHLRGPVLGTLKIGVPEQMQASDEPAEFVVSLSMS